MYRIIGIADDGKFRLYDTKESKVLEVAADNAGNYDILPSFELRCLQMRKDKDYYVLRALKDSYIIVDKQGETRRVTAESCKRLVDRLNNMSLVNGQLEFLDKTRSTEHLFDIEGDSIHRCDTESGDMVYIPSYIRRIGRKAFKDVEGRYFRMCNVEIIEPKAFINSNAVLLDFNNRIKEIGDEAFKGCVALNFVRGLAKLSKVSRRAFSGCGHLQYFPFNQITGDLSIGEEAFMNTGITCVKFRNKEANVTIGARAFKQCTLMTEVELDTHSEINEYAFYRCRGIEQILLTDGCAKIGRYAFSEIDRLSEVQLPDESVIHDLAFNESTLPNVEEAAS